MKIINRRKEILLLVAICFLGLLFRLKNINEPLWQDEAETVINAKQVLLQGYPSGEYLGKPIFENASFIPAGQDDERYQFISTNYFGSKFEKNKGWLTYYYLAAWLKAFPFSNSLARLPFILISLLTIILTFALGKLVFNQRVGLGAAFIQAVNYWVIFYETQARYYALFVFLSLLVLFFYWRLLKERSWLNYLAVTMATVLLFHTHFVAAAVALIFIVLEELIYYKYRLLEIYHCWKYWWLLFILLTFSWLLLTNSLINSAFPFSGQESKWWWLAVILVYVLAIFILRKFLNLFNLKSETDRRLTYLFHYLIVFLIITLLIMPGESFVARAFLPLLPILAVIFIQWLFNFFQLLRQRDYPKALVKFLACCLILTMTQLSFYDFSYRDKISQIPWLPQAISYLESRGISNQTLILVDSHQLAYWLYYPYDVELIWPLKKDFIDRWPKEMYLVFDRDLNWCDVNYLQLALYCHPERRNYSDKIKNCQQTDLTFSSKHLSVYYCPAPS